MSTLENSPLPITKPQIYTKKLIKSTTSKTTLTESSSSLNDNTNNSTPEKNTIYSQNKNNNFEEKSLSQNSINLISTPEKNTFVKEVYKYNFEKELKKINILLEEGYNYIGMDTEFPGTVYGLQELTKNFYYETMKININSLKLIQLGITLSNSKGEHPTKYSYYTWQFNFKFNLKNDIYSNESIELLIKAGIDFEKLNKDGINPKKFAENFMISGLVLNPDVYWISFQGSYDFGYLLRLLINEPLPKDEKDFMENLNIYFPNFYDIRILTKNKCCLHGSLNKLANLLKVERNDNKIHQAGSDSYVTIEVLFKMIHYGMIDNNFIQSEFKNIVYGIGLGEDDQKTIQYIKINQKNIKENNDNKGVCKNVKKMVNGYNGVNVIFGNKMKSVFVTNGTNVNNYISINYFYPTFFYSTEYLNKIKSAQNCQIVKNKMQEIKC